ncbi:alpha/beta hydrolase family protein [Actinomadura viridis]|uniref:S-formylglutathione hydrolase FrmB n=1 Tax=Actinomadura viridis TaxID=58110 RepID=A0A931DPW1_9ACTN|nr:alpha/beta hydrolase family protein [Actinomadura viridis]MBG6093895.1 S-formylglutathione hydrolase FrmB [Actinomadura viridis]
MTSGNGRGRALGAAGALAAVLVVLPGGARADPGPAPASGAEVIDEKQVRPRVVDLTVRSPALAGTGKVRLLTPDGWEQRGATRTWPVLYLLPGGHGEYESFTEEYDIERLPELRNVLVVTPQMPFFGFYSDWWNDGRGGAPAVETFHLDEVRTLLERGYGAGPRRAIAGESQGGYGAVKYAARHPGMFRAAASYSGFLSPPQYVKAISGGAEYLKVDWRRIWGDPVRQRDIWLANDPYHLAERLRGTPVYISSGDGTPGVYDDPVDPDPVIPGMQDLAAFFPEEVVSLTEAVMADESRTVAHRLTEVGVPVTTHFYRGTHGTPYWKRELRRSLPMLLRALNGGPSRG